MPGIYSGPPLSSCSGGLFSGHYGRIALNLYPLMEA